MVSESSAEEQHIKRVRGAGDSEQGGRCPPRQDLKRQHPPAGAAQRANTTIPGRRRHSAAGEQRERLGSSRQSP